MTDQPKENEGMRKAVANEAVTLPDLFTRVMDVCPAIRHSTPVHIDGLGWGIHERRIDDSMAESLILAACVRWLADNGHQPICIEKNNSDRTPPHHPQYLPGRFIVEIRDTPIYQQTFSDNLTIAALLAVEAVCKERGQ